MKKIIILLLIIPFLNSLLNTNTKHISDDLIRIRVLANSNSEHDLKIKKDISSKIQTTMYNLLKDIKDVDIARNVIKENIPKIDEVVNSNLNENYSYDIKYGYNYFPQKTYKGVTYEEGEYESLLVTLGEGKGDNWWCILFPPFCLIEAEESIEKVEYSFFFEELIDKILH